MNPVTNSFVGIQPSTLMPDIPKSPPITDLFSNFALNWATLTPVLAVLFGILFFGFLIKKIKDTFWGDDD